MLRESSPITSDRVSNVGVSGIVGVGEGVGVGVCAAEFREKTIAP